MNANEAMLIYFLLSDNEGISEPAYSALKAQFPDANGVWALVDCQNDRYYVAQHNLHYLMQRLGEFSNE